MSHKQVMRDAGLPTLSVRQLSQTDSMKPIADWMRAIQTRRGIANQDVMVCFDVDDTLSDASKQHPTKYLRGGNETRAFIESLDSAKIKWFIVSARMDGVERGEHVVLDVYGEHLLNLPVPNWSRRPHECQFRKSRAGGTHTQIASSEQQDARKGFESKKQLPLFKYGGRTYNVYHCNNSIAVNATDNAGNLAIPKWATVEYGISLYYQRRRPKLIVFVDDNVQNLVDIAEHFKREQDADLALLLVLFTPHSPEADPSIE